MDNSSGLEEVIVKRERNCNWSVEEKDTLLGLLEDMKDVIGKRRASVLDIKKRNEAWALVHSKFSGIFPRRTSLNKLKELYQRMKAQAKKEIATHKKSMKTTDGGGPAKQEPSDTSQSQRITDISPMDFAEKRNIFDEDSLISNDGDTHSAQGKEEVNSDDEFIALERTEEEICTASRPVPVEAIVNVTDDQRKIPNGIPPTKRHLEDVIEEMQRKEHTKRLRFMEEEHAAKMENLRLKRQILKLKLCAAKEKLELSESSFTSTDE